MAVGVFTSRIVLDALGKTDFGIYSAVGGIVIVFSFLNGVMASACNRYFAIEIGRDNTEGLRKVFSLNITVFIFIALIIIVLSESAGLWFVANKLVYPPERVVAVHWVYQLSILTFIISMLTTPFRALIIAYENMKVFAYCGIAEALLKLGLVLALCILTADKLILYGIAMLLVNVSIGAFYFTYCYKHYVASHYVRQWDGQLFREIVGYTGWNVIGNLAVIGKTQGINILFNVFFGPIVNAAQAIATQVSSVVYQFSYNFTTAVAPQITKSYSVGHTDEMLALLCKSSKYSYFLMFIVVLPVTIMLPLLLDIWLVEVPEGCVVFAQLTLINALIDSLSIPTAYAIQATGNVKWYQIFIGITLLLIIPISYLLIMCFNINAWAVLIVSICASVVAQIVRVIFVKRVHGLLVRTYIKSVVFPIVGATIVAIVIPITMLNTLTLTPLNYILIATISLIMVIIAIWLVGLTKTERSELKMAICKLPCIQLFLR